MVGLYHKRRAQRTQSKAVSVTIHTISVLAIIGALLVLIVAIFFTGSRIKNPLASYLSSKSGLNVSIHEAEFSPLYPDVIKLKDVSFGQSLISEFYLEYQLSSLWSDELKIKDIYINGLKLDPRDLEQLTNSQFGYEQIVADSVRFHHTPLQTTHLQSPDATIRLNEVTFNHDHGLNFTSGTISTDQASYFNHDISGLTVDFARSANGLELKQFNLSVLGGMISGFGQYLLPATEQGFNYGQTSTAITTTNSDDITTIVLPELNLSKVVIQGDVDLANHLNLQAQKVNLSDVIFASSNATALVTASPNNKENNGQNRQNGQGGQDSNATPNANTNADNQVNHNYIIQGINGTIDNLQLNAQGFTGNYQGSIDAFALHHIQTIFEHNQGNAQFTPEQINFDFNGQLFTGDYALSGYLLPQQKELTLKQLKIDKSKLAINPPRLSYLQHQLGQYNIKLEQADFSHLEFLSFLNELPLSIQDISGNLKNVHIVPELLADSQAEAQLDGDAFAAWYAFCSHLQALNPQTPSQIQWQLRNTQYSNLLVQELNGTLAITPDYWQLTLPRVFFRESSLSVDSTLARDLYQPSSLFIKAADFESADLNSNLINHMLTGKVDFDLELNSNRINLLSNNKTTNQALEENHQRVINGTINLEALNLLISDLGLDLINGGKKKDFDLNGTELLSAMQGSVAGISNLSWHNTIANNLLQAKATLDLATAQMNFTGDYDFFSHEINGQASFISLAKDSKTNVSLDGTFPEPHFKIHALQRGIDRPGLYLPEYDTGAFAKEQTDAAAVLNGTIQIEPPETADITQKEPKEGEVSDEPSLIEQNKNQNPQQPPQGTSDADTTTTPAPEQGSATTEPEPTDPTTGNETTVPSEPSEPQTEQGTATTEPEPTAPTTGNETTVPSEPNEPQTEQGPATTEPEPTTPPATGNETTEPSKPQTEQGSTTTEPEPTAPTTGSETTEPSKPLPEQDPTTKEPEPTAPTTGNETTVPSEPSEPQTEQGSATTEPEPTAPTTGSETTKPSKPQTEQGTTTTGTEPTTPTMGSETTKPNEPQTEQGTTTTGPEPTVPTTGSETTKPNEPSKPSEPKTEQGTTIPPAQAHETTAADKEAADLFEINLLKDAIIDSLRQKPDNEVEPEPEPDFNFNDDDEMIF